MDLVLMFDEAQYALIDFGNGEKLERFGGRTIRRETPSVDVGTAKTDDWVCDAAYEKHYGSGPGKWKPASPTASSTTDDWSIEHDRKRFLLKLAPSGQVGVFPEQSANWDWIDKRRKSVEGLNAINLFAYTGGTTMALANCGVSVTHVDAAKPAVTWARENAQASGLADAPIRWIVDDALAYMRREVKRGKKYQIIVADPPSFGRAPGGDVWKIQRDLPTLIELATQLAGDELKMLILSCHTPGINADDLKQQARETRRLRFGSGETLELTLKSQSGARLPSGDCFRWGVR